MFGAIRPDLKLVMASVDRGHVATRAGSDPRRARNWASPVRALVVVLATGIGITSLLAASERAATTRERELRFEVAAEAVQQQLSARVEDLGDEFEAGAAFIGATHPAPSSSYQEFFARLTANDDASDTGMLFLEDVPRDDLPTLVTRERRLSDPDFTVTTVGFAAGDRALIMTRASGNIGQIVDPYLGYDVASARPLLTAGGFPGDGYALRVAATPALLQLIGAEQRSAADEGPEIPDVTPFFVGPVVNGEGEEVGLAVRFLYGTQLVENLRLPEHINVRLSVQAIEEPIAQIPDDPATGMGDSGLFQLRQVRTAGHPWTVEVWADPAFDTGTGLSPAQSTWAAGLAASVGLGLAVATGLAARNRLVGTNFELELARTLATTDPLTGLLNRQGLIDGARARPSGSPAVLFFVDLDGFKPVNDEWGHEAGDAVLSAVGRALRVSFRRGDLVARMGGDEFVVVQFDEGAPDSGTDVASQAQRLVDRVGAVDERVSCSVGVARRRSGEQTDVKELLRRADEAMYAAKRDGGARFAVSGPT